MFMRIAAIACAACFGVCQAGVIYDFETIPEGTTLPITFPDGTVIDSTTNSAFQVRTFSLMFLSGHSLRDDPPYAQNHSIRIRFPQAYNAISLDFTLNSLTVGPWLTMYVTNGSALVLTVLAR